jgi:hypothetical protein
MEKMTTWQAICQRPCTWFSAPLATEEDAKHEGDSHVLEMVQSGERGHQHKFYVQSST